MVNPKPTILNKVYRIYWFSVVATWLQL